MRRAGLVTIVWLGIVWSPAVNAGVDAATGPCIVHGTIVETITVYDSAQGGEASVLLTGTQRWLELSSFAAKATRVHLKSGTTKPSLRVDGFADWSSVSIGSQHDVVVASPLLSIRATVPLRLVESGGTVTASPRNPTFRDVSATVTCSDLRIAKANAAPPPPSGGSPRISVGKSIALFAEPKGTPALTLEHAGEPSAVGFSAYESINGFVRVRLVRDVLLDGWVRQSDLVAPGPTGLGTVGTFGMGSGWGTSGSSQYAQRDTEVRLGPTPTATLAGTLEKGARVVRWGGTKNKAPWIEIRIFDSDAREPPGKAFFVREGDLGSKAP